MNHSPMGAHMFTLLFCAQRSRQITISCSSTHVVEVRPASVQTAMLPTSGTLLQANPGPRVLVASGLYTA